MIEQPLTHFPDRDSRNNHVGKDRFRLCFCLVNKVAQSRVVRIVARLRCSSIVSYYFFDVTFEAERRRKNGFNL